MCAGWQAAGNQGDKPQVTSQKAAAAKEPMRRGFEASLDFLALRLHDAADQATIVTHNGCVPLALKVTLGRRQLERRKARPR